MKTGRYHLRRRSCIALIALLILSVHAHAFELNHRFNSLTLQFGTDSFATNNAFGSAFGDLARGMVQDSIQTSVADGSISIVLSFPGLADLRGSNATSFAVGIANADPVLLSGNPASYSGNSDLDWWYVFDRDDVDGGGNAHEQLPAAIAASVLNAGPARITFPNVLTAGALDVWNTYLRANVGGSSTPSRSTNHFPPGHRENLDPALVTFATLAQGRLRGNISAASLASTPVPANFTGGSFSCGQGYTTNHTLLDLLVSGCTSFGFIIVIRATQPDQFDPNAPLLGAGPPYRFVATQSRVTGARDRLGNAVNLQSAINASAYSTYFTFTTDRVIAFTEPSGRPVITDVTRSQGAVRFHFTNAPRASFSVLSTTNVEASATNWTVLGASTQNTPGVFEFIDTATDAPRRFYKLRSP